MKNKDSKPLLKYAYSKLHYATLQKLIIINNFYLLYELKSQYQLDLE